MALSLPRKVVVAEVGPRDGLQSFPRFIDTDTKVAMIDKLSDLGLPIIEVSSFAHPNIVPHLRDAEEVFERIKRRPATVYRALVPNARGAERGAKARVDEMLGLITISATYTRKNQNMTIDQAIAQNLTSFKIADASGIPFVMALGMAFWCAYEGQIPEESVIAVVQRLHDGGIRRFYLAGSLGMEDPAHVNRLFRRLAELFPNASFGFQSTICRGWRPPTSLRRSMPARSGWKARFAASAAASPCQPGLARSAIFQPKTWWRC